MKKNYITISEMRLDEKKRKNTLIQLPILRALLDFIEKTT